MAALRRLCPNPNILNRAEPGLPRMRTEADAEQHGWHELQREVRIEQGAGGIRGAALQQAVGAASDGAGGHHRVAEARAQLQICGRGETHAV